MVAHLFAWFEHAVGMTNGSGPEYLFWSGIGSDIQEITLLGAVLGLYYKHNCHQKKCPRIGKHSFDGTPYCTRHNPQFGDK
jgi:hypothetical protein